MDIKIQERHVGPITVLDITGKLTIDEAAEHLRDKINSLLEQKETRIILNLRGVPYIDSGGLGQLIASFGSVKRAGGTLKLLHVNSKNHDLLSITSLVTVFESFDSEEKAIKSFDVAPATHA
jgi:anti-sigma B factor antagonist